MRPMIFIFCLITLLVSGCGSHSEKPQVAHVSVERASQRTSVRQFCTDLAEDISVRKKGVIVSRFDKSRFVKNTMSTTQFSVHEMHSASTFIENLTSNVVDMLESSLFYRGSWYVQSVKDNGARGRCVLQSGVSGAGFSIIEFYLFDKDGMVISNWLDHMQGILASDRMRTLLVDFSSYAEGAEQNEEMKQDFQRFVDFNAAISEKNVSEAFRHYALIPDEMKKSGMLALNLAVLSSIVGQRYDEAAGILVNNTDYAGRPLLVIDYLVSQRKFEQAHAMLGAVENDIGPSSVLEIIRSSVHYEQGNLEDSWKHALKSIDIDKGYEGAYWHVFSQFVEQELYADAVLVLDILYKAWGYDFSHDMFADENIYKDLVHAPSFKSWIARL